MQPKSHPNTNPAAQGCHMGSGRGATSITSSSSILLEINTRSKRGNKSNCAMFLQLPQGHSTNILDCASQLQAVGAEEPVFACCCCCDDNLQQKGDKELQAVMPSTTAAESNRLIGAT